MNKSFYHKFKKLENPEDFIINCPYGLKDEDMFDDSKLALLVRKIRSLKKLNPVDLLFIESLDVDPFRYVTLASLCMSIYTSKFLPDKSIVANATDKHISLVCKEWLIHLNDDNIVPEVPLFVDNLKIRR